MPELPEVETTRRGIEPHVKGKRVTDVIVRQPQLRWPVPTRAIRRQLIGEKLESISRRGKYLLLATPKGTLIIHLGMSGSLRIIKSDEPAMAHDHVDIVISDSSALRLNDPRRFGAVLWTTESIEQHKLIAHLGPEPLEANFTADYIFNASRGRKGPVKNFVMDAKVLVGVGNIYANEALFKAGIHPKRAAGRISRDRYAVLVEEIKSTLAKAIEHGGTTLRDFIGSDGKPGYFKQSLLVYGRADKPCRVCKTILKEVRLAQRSTVFCSQCQR